MVEASVSDRNKVSSFGLPRLWSDVDISSAKFLLSEEKLSNPPSLADGMEMEIERNLRFLGCELIQTAGILLKLPQVAPATAQILYQRYFYSKSFVRNSFEDVAMACLVLASKIEEAPRRNRDIINVFHHLKQLSRQRTQPLENRKKPGPLLLDHNYIAVKNRVIKAERRVLKELGFVVHVKHPHKLVTGYLKALDLDRSRLIIQKAWNYMNDGLRTDVFVRYSAETIACSCIFLAARVCKVPLPMDPKPWWELFSAREKDILDICRLLLNQYTRTKSPSWKRLEVRVIELRAKLQERQKIKQENAGADITPNPHGGDKFSPVIQSRLGSPNIKKESSASRKVNGESGDNFFKNRKDKQFKGRIERKRRSRSASSEGSLTPPLRKKDLPKRYSGAGKDRRVEKKRRPRGSVSPSFRQPKSNRPNFDDYRSSSSVKKRQRRLERSPVSPLGPVVQQNFVGFKSKSSKDRDTTGSGRESKQARKDREREVKQALGKRKRTSVSPEKDSKSSGKNRQERV